MTYKLTAPEGYKYHDKRTDRLYSEVITTDKERYELVPDTTDKPMEV